MVIEKEIISIFDKIILNKKDNQQVTNSLEKQIDEMVYKIYELADEEIAIIEGKNV